MQDQHIASAYDRDLEALQALIIKMGGMVEAAIRDAAEALTNRDTELADKVRKGDKAIDALDDKVNEEAARVIALRAPVSKDLRMILAIIRFAAAMERIGDYAKNLAKRVGTLSELRPVDGTDATLRRMARDVEIMLRDLIDAFIRRDAALAADVIARDADIDQTYNSLFREFLTHMMEDPRNITPCMHLHFIAKNTERMGDLVTNMAEQVIYLATGQRPEEDRVKKDQTPYMTAPE
ncbi:phosphate signaling complex protein PhoU [Wenxinia marina]|uniref:Phosphate-specific transport system accessory protein PhoU n=1 Tax=Wenxinia marina DSM 24838 TaxID=1123501 RepID=A0A0D0Q9K9_9RHOB|nr:phosphate signaling complex protein PhoU [Wenxinia marina]KIQ67703.1 phosphate uptake regulator, PhoU [Wenxinia marina DSM 24838]GGL77828.1 phosphate transport system regulatory protein PhoU [Wenxinia marina]